MPTAVCPTLSTASPSAPSKSAARAGPRRSTAASGCSLHVCALLCAGLGLLDLNSNLNLNLNLHQPRPRPRWRRSVHWFSISWSEHAGRAIEPQHRPTQESPAITPTDVNAPCHINHRPALSAQLSGEYSLSLRCTRTCTRTRKHPACAAACRMLLRRLVSRDAKLGATSLTSVPAAAAAHCLREAVVGGGSAEGADLGGCCAHAAAFSDPFIHPVGLPLSPKGADA